MKNDSETNQIIRTVKELFRKSANNPDELSKLIDKYLIPHELEKKQNAEVSTPYILRQEMLNKIPPKFWQKPRKVFEPCSGKGGFLIDILGRFMIGLRELIPDSRERYRTIVEECLYWSDINPTNVFICKLLLDPHEKYKLKYNEGNTLTLNVKKKFDAVIGNPPYNSSGNTGTGNTIWQLFVRKALEEWITKNGILVFVHPPNWRKPCYERSQLKGLFKLMTQTNTMIYLEMHGIKDGQKTFNCGTKYDWYYIRRKENISTPTTIIDEDNKSYSILLSNLEWLANKNIDKIIKLITKTNNLEVIMDSSYHAIRDYVKDTKDETYKYPLIHSTPQTGVRYKYSSINDKGHFNVKKVIFGEAGINHVVIDMDGKYGMTQGAMAIKVNTRAEADKIKQALISDKFQEILKSCLWGNFRVDWRLFTYFKKDFWKEFV